MSSQRFEDLKDELISLKDKIRLHLRRNANESTVRKLLNDGDNLLEITELEIEKCPPSVQVEISNRYLALKNEWNAFKITILRRPDFATPKLFSDSNNEPTIWSGQQRTQHQALTSGLESLEQTSQSLYRADAVAREAVEIGVQVMENLGHQRETLLRARENLDGTQNNLRKSHRLLRMINNQALTNKCLLIVIIMLEICIIVSIVFFKFIIHHH